MFDSCSQDSSKVLCIIENLLKEILSSDPTITKAFLISDNAGCYHGSETLLSLPCVATKTGIEVLLVDFSDPQGGQSPSDRFEAVFKSNVRRYLNEKKDVTDTSLFFKACRSNAEIFSVKVSEYRLPVESNTNVLFRFSGITNSTNFKKTEFQYIVLEM